MQGAKAAIEAMKGAFEMERNPFSLLQTELKNN
jgi:hypothetical protein